MRRSHGGWLAALVLLVSGCASGPDGNDAASVSREAIVVPTLAVADRAPAPPGEDDQLTVLVSSAGGVDSPALDALASVLAARPGIGVVIVATATANDVLGETGTTAALLETTTRSGLTAQAVNASAADAVAAGIDAHPDLDLVVVGIDGRAAVGDDIRDSPAVGAARVASARDVPAIAVTAADEGGLDLSAAVLALQQVLDLHLDALLERGGASVLTVPGCAAGTVRSLVEVDIGRGPTPVADCASAPVDPDDDVEAHAAGHVTLTRLR